MAQQPFIFELNVNFSATVQLPFVDLAPFDCVVDWGDGSQDTITAFDDPASAHSYSPETYTVTITGYCGGWSVNNGAIKNYLTDIVQFGTQTYFDSYAFTGCSLLGAITATDFPGFHDQAARAFFNSCTNLEIDLTDCYMGNITVGADIFDGVSIGDGQNWQFLRNRFFQNSINAQNFNSDVSSWADTMGTASPERSIIAVEGMFNGASSFNCGLAAGVSGNRMSNWNLYLSPNLSRFFSSCTAFNQDINTNTQNAGQPDEYIAWDTSSVTNFEGCFSNATSFNQDISGWDVSSATSLRTLFQGASSFNNGGVGGVGVGLDTWDVSSATTFYGMFYRSGFNQYIGSWILNPSTNVDCGIMFQESSFNQDIGGWTNTSSITTMVNMFMFNNAYNNGGVGGVGAGIDQWDVSNVTVMASAFRSASSFNQYIGSWDVSSVLNMSQMFENASAFNQDISGWERNAPTVSTLSNVTNMSRMFQGASTFNQDISNWDVSNVTNFTSLLESATAFNQDLSSWKMYSATICDRMFYNSVAVGMSAANVEATLYGWSLDPNTATGVSATSISFHSYAAGSNMDLALNDPTNGLVAAKGWNVTGITIV
jgi:surface protein